MRTSRLGCVSLVIAVLMLALPVCAQAQAAQFSYVQLTLGGNFAHPANVAVDASGNIFVADAGNSAVKEIPAGCITSTCVVPLGSGFNGPNGVAVDASGNVIVGDTLNNAVKVILAVNGSIPAISPTINPLGGGFAAPAGVAKDASGNVYVSDFGNSAVKLIPPGCGDATCVKTLANISYPNGIAVDGSGNVFVTSAISNAVYEILAVNGSIPATLPTINPLGSGFSYPNGATVDASGNVYVADSGNNALKVILAVNGSIPATSPTIITLDSNLYWPTGVVLDASGIIYVADYKNDRVLELKTRVVNFGTVATSQTSTALSLTFTFNSAGTIAAPVALTQGAPGLDFAVASGGTCTTGSTYNIGDTCTVNVTFQPKFSGTRYGAVLLYSNASPAKVIGTAYLTGTGQGPQIAFQPGLLSSALISNNSSFNWLGGISVDGKENVYLADGYYAVWALTAPASGTNYTNSLLGGLTGGTPNISYDCPQYTAVDGAGNIYVADYGCNNNNPAVYQLALQPDGSYIRTNIGSGYVRPMGVAVDSSGNVYVSDIGNGFVYKLTLWNGSYTQAVIASGIGNLADLAVDGNGNVFIASDGPSLVTKLTLQSNGNYATTTLGSGWVLPSEIAIDGNGNLYVSDMYAWPNTVSRLTPQPGGSYAQSGTILRTQLAAPVGVAVDGAGNPFIVDSATNNAFKLDIADGPALNFPTSTPHGSIDSEDGTQKATIQNIGNEPLTFSSIVASANFQLDSGTTTCSTSTALAVNATCVIGVYFYPTTSGQLSGAVTLADNALNPAGATQTIALSGNASVLPPAPAIGSEPGLSTIATSATFTFSDTLSGVTFQCSLDSVSYAACSSPAAYSSLALGTHTFAVEAVDASSNVSAPTTYNWTIVNPPPAPTFITDPPSSTTSTTANFSWVDSQSNVTYLCSLDGAVYAACQVSTNPIGSATYTSLALGAHSLGIEAADSYGNVGAPATYNWTITVAPVHVTVGTVPSGLSFTVDGTSYTNSMSLSWVPGSIHTIATTATQTTTGIQGTFVSWSDGGAISHTVTATAGTTSYTANFTALYLLATAASPTSGGTVLPFSGTYYPVGTVVNLTAAFSPGYAFGVWSGNVANATSASTTVTMSAPQSVIANFYPSSTLLPEWTWEGGSSTANQSGAYGTLLTPSLNNLPGGRSASANWAGSGNLWIFGGKGYDGSNTVGYLSDLWKFNLSTGWEWMSGSKTANASGILSGSGSNPGAREAAVSWTDSNGNFWLFGGYGYDVNGTGGFLHDLWEFNSSTDWTLISGSSTVGTTTGAGGQLGIYGTINQFGALNLPGSREYSTGWADSRGNLWLFGGEAVDSKGNLGYLNDLWEFSPSQGTAGEWAWQGGSNVVNKNSASYGTQGTPLSTNVPGGRLSAMTWTDKSGNFWLFGGEGYDSNGVFGELNDLWKFVPSTTGGTWTWVSGSNTTIAYSGQPGAYGTLGVPSAGNMPGSRQDATSWTDSSGNLWLLGGIGLDANGNSAPLSDLWMFNPSTTLWTWMGGSNTSGAAGVYGTPQTPAAGNMPGSRYFATSWTDSSGTAWLFGGYGKDGNGTYGYLNDLWKFGAYAPPVPVIATGPASPTTVATAAFTFSDSQAGVTFQCSLDGAAYAACSSGVSYSSLGTGPHSFAVKAQDATGNLSNPATYTWIIATPMVQVTVGTSPSGLSFSVDGTTYASTQSLTWNVGDSHTIATTSPQTLSGAQDTFASWSDGGAISHLVTAAAGTTSYTATFTVVVPAPLAALSPNTLFFPYTQVGGTATAMTAMLANNGNAELLEITPSITGTNASDFTIATASTCGSTLAAGQSCTFIVNFAPAGKGSRSATLSVADNATSSSQTVNLVGTGVVVAQVAQLQFVPGQLTAIAGTGAAASGCVGAGDNGPALQATFCTASAVAQDPAGNIYVVDQNANVVRKIDTSGNIAIFAGSGSSLGDGGLANKANLNNPIDVVADVLGNVYISDYGNGRVRKVDAKTGIITTFAGGGNNVWFNAGPAVGISIQPGGITFDPAGNMFIADTNQQIVVKVDASGNASLFAGVVTNSGPGQAGYNGDSILAINAWLNSPQSVASDQVGNIYIADTNNYRVRRVDVSTGMITTFAGNGTQGYTGDGSSATSAEINAYGISTNLAGELFISGTDTFHRVRKVDVNGNISTYAGGGAGAIGGPAAGATLAGAYLTRVDANGTLLIPTGTQVLGAGPQGILQFGNENDMTTSSPLTVSLINTGNASLTFNGSGIVTGAFAIAPGGSCTFAPLSPGQSCTVNVTFTPTSTGAAIGSISFAGGAPNSPNVVQLSGTGVQEGVVATPKILPATGTYSTNQTVTITDATTGATICYTTDNTVPTASNGSCTHGTIYSAASNVVAVQTGYTVQAIGTLSGDTNSAVASATYTLQAVAPTLTPPGGTYNGVQSVTLSTTTTGSQIYYTLDGSTPTDAPGSTSMHYSGTAIPVTQSGTVINAITIDDGYVNSAVSTGTYILQFPAVTLASAALSFGNQNDGTTTSQSSVLRNSGAAPLTITSIAVTGASSSTFVESDNCVSASPLAVNATCTITVTFAPTTPGNDTATVAISDNATGSPQGITLSGTGVVPPDYGVSASTPTQSVVAGGIATYGISVQSIGGYTGSVLLSVTGLPPNATASFSPNPVTLGSVSLAAKRPADAITGGTSTLTVQTAPKVLTGDSRNRSWPLVAPAIGLLMLMPSRRLRRQYLLRLMLIFTVLGIVTAMVGCGGGFAVPQQSQTYTLIITGTGTSTTGTTTTHTTSVLLTVK